MRASTCLLLLLAGLETSTAGIRFLPGPVDDIMKRADRLHQPVLIDFMTDWCRWCDSLDANTYADRDVAAFVEGHIVPLKINAEKGEGIELAKKYGVAAYPTILLVQSNGEEIDRITGYAPPAAFLATLKDFVNGVNTFSSVMERVNKNPDDPALRYALAKKYADRNDVRGTTEQFRRMLDLDPKNDLGHREEAEFAVAMGSLRLNNDPAPLSSYVDAHPNALEVRGALATLFIRALRFNDAAGGRKYFEQYLARWPADANAMNNYAWNCAQRGFNLDHASAVAKRAVELASTAKEKAEFLDTEATVQFRLGKTEEAISLETDALALMKDAPESERKGYEETLKGFISARSSATSR